MILKNKALNYVFNKINYVFKEPSLFDSVIGRITAGINMKGLSLEHLKHFERLELLGDAVLNMVVSDMLFKQYPNEPNGVLSKIKANLVCTNTLLNISDSTGLSMFYKEDKREVKSKSILENSVEALIGAIYVDGGFYYAKSFIVNQWGDKANTKGNEESSKTALQVWTQKNKIPLPKYDVVETKGEKHSLRFEVRVSVQGVGCSNGSGTSIKEGESNAASVLLDRINNTDKSKNDLSGDK